MNAEIDILKEMGVEFRTGVEVGRDVTLPELRQQGYEAFISASARLREPPSAARATIWKNVWTGLDFLRAVNSGKKPEVGKRLPSSAAAMWPWTWPAPPFAWAPKK